MLIVEHTISFSSFSLYVQIIEWIFDFLNSFCCDMCVYFCCLLCLYPFALWKIWFKLVSVYCACFSILCSCNLSFKMPFSRAIFLWYSRGKVNTFSDNGKFCLYRLLREECYWCFALSRNWLFACLSTIFFLLWKETHYIFGSLWIVLKGSNWES